MSYIKWGNVIVTCVIPVEAALALSKVSDPLNDTFCLLYCYSCKCIEFNMK